MREEDPHLDKLTYPLRKITCELAIYMGFVEDLDLMPDNHPEDPMMLVLHHTNAEQASALAQNADSITVLTHILDSKLPQVLPDNPHAGRTNNAPQDDRLASIHAPAPWSATMKCSTHVNAHQEDHIDAIQYFLNGNTIIITGEHTTAEDMKDYYALIASLISPNQFKAHPDHVTEELADKWAGFKDLVAHGQPSWLGYESVLALQSSTSISFSFASDKDASKFRNQGVLYLFSMSCRTSHYIEYLQVYYCNLCSSIDHRTDACRTGAMCNVCMSTDHSTDNHPTEGPRKSKMCNACTKHLGKQKALGGVAPSGGGKPTNHKKNAKANETEVKDPTDPMQSPSASTAESKRDIENKKDHEDFKLRKACWALLAEADSR
ncbi:hypothetical protein BS47DRAFT_1369055 [Hydnum rufescens UP504]|uniref:Uncharacterized protein n=1 Tax=Hydnum rufescens UP504 TaxID=1448309 RepID=A0A9P6DMG5_9AGAM|nr:hypothetical protein BS47DRAFT_1369055 [Hydnum rufescens UP504]